MAGKPGDQMHPAPRHYARHGGYTGPGCRVLPMVAPLNLPLGSLALSVLSTQWCNAAGILLGNTHSASVQSVTRGGGGSKERLVPNQAQLFCATQSKQFHISIKHSAFGAMLHPEAQRLP